MEFTKEQKLYAQVVQEAWENAEFKKELIANPVSTIEKLTGKKINLPEGKKMVVRDQTDESAVYINIPAKNDEVELSEEQLDMAAGGGLAGAIIGGAIGALGGPAGVIAGAVVGSAIEDLL